jgi:hypothetical protein
MATEKDLVKDGIPFDQRNDWAEGAVRELLCRRLFGKDELRDRVLALLFEDGEHYARQEAARLVLNIERSTWQLAAAMAFDLEVLLDHEGVPSLEAGWDQDVRHLRDAVAKLDGLLAGIIWRVARDLRRG